jgi:ribose transport system permease protein
MRDGKTGDMAGGAGKIWLTRAEKLGLLFALVGIYVLFALIAPPSFRTAANLETIARQTVIVGVAAVGMTLVIISGGIDLSVGSLVALAGVVTGWCLAKAGTGPLAALVAAVLVCCAFGMLSGLLITGLRMVPFIVTLGMMLVCLNDLLASLGPQDSWMLFPAGVWTLIILAVTAAVMLKYTVLGRHIVAIGSNEMTARLCGVGVERVKMVVYALNGSMAGVAGLMQFSRLTVGDPTVAVGLELDVIAAVVIGGGSLSGGEGSIAGSVIGALIMTVIRSGCTQLGLHNWVQEMITGAIIVIAVALDRLRHTRSR